MPIKTNKALMKPYQVARWIEESGLGARLDYHRGYLPLDRDGNFQIDDIAIKILEAAENGTVHLFQKRHGNFDYTYFAIKQRIRRVSG